MAQVLTVIVIACLALTTSALGGVRSNAVMPTSPSDKDCCLLSKCQKVLDLAAKMQTSEEVLQQVLGAVGDTEAPFLLQSAKTFAVTMQREHFKACNGIMESWQWLFAAKASACKTKLCTGVTIPMATNLREMATNPEVDPRLLKKLTTPAEEVSEKVVLEAPTLAEARLDKLIATAEWLDVTNLNSQDVPGAINDYIPVVYWVDRSVKKVPSTCSGDADAVETAMLSSQSKAGCASACNAPGKKCVGFQYFGYSSNASKSHLCFLFSKFKSISYYHSCDAVKPSFLQQRHRAAVAYAPLEAMLVGHLGIEATCYGKISKFSGVILAPIAKAKNRCLYISAFGKAAAEVQANKTIAANKTITIVELKVDEKAFQQATKEKPVAEAAEKLAAAKAKAAAKQAEEKKVAADFVAAALKTSMKAAEKAAFEEAAARGKMRVRMEAAAQARLRAKVIKLQTKHAQSPAYNAAVIAAKQEAVALAGGAGFREVAAHARLDALGRARTAAYEAAVKASKEKDAAYLKSQREAEAKRVAHKFSEQSRSGLKRAADRLKADKKAATASSAAELKAAQKLYEEAVKLGHGQVTAAAKLKAAKEAAAGVAKFIAGVAKNKIAAARRDLWGLPAKQEAKVVAKNLIKKAKVVAKNLIADKRRDLWGLPASKKAPTAAAHDEATALVPVVKPSLR